MQIKSFKQYISEDGVAAAAAGPTNVTAGVAGMGAQGPKSNQSEPGVYLKKKRGYQGDPRMPMGIGKRKDF